MRDSAAIKQGKLRSCVCWIRFKSTCIPPVSQCQMQQLRTDYCLCLIITASFQHLMLSAGNHALEWRLILLRKTPNELRGGSQKRGRKVPLCRHPSLEHVTLRFIHLLPWLKQLYLTPHPLPALQLQWHPTPPCSTASVTPHPLTALQLQWHPTPSLLYSFSDTPPPPCSTASVACVSVSLVLLKMISMRSGMPVCTPPHLSEVSPTVPLTFKQFQHTSDSPLSSFQGRSMSASSVHASLLRATDGVMSSCLKWRACFISCTLLSSLLYSFSYHSHHTVSCVSNKELMLPHDPPPPPHL